MTPDERDEFWIRAYRLRATAYRAAAAGDELTAARIEMTRGLRAFTSAMARGDARDIAAHPDLSELNVQLDGYYGDASDR